MKSLRIPRWSWQDGRKMTLSRSAWTSTHPVSITEIKNLSAEEALRSSILGSQVEPHRIWERSRRYRLSSVEDHTHFSHGMRALVFRER